MKSTLMVGIEIGIVFSSLIVALGASAWWPAWLCIGWLFTLYRLSKALS